MRLKLLISLFMLLTGFSSFSAEDDFQMRVSWVRTLKELLVEIEKNEDHKMVLLEKKFFDSWSLITSAWADARYDCFYAGWPSTLRASGGKKLCQLPERTNSSYEKGICKGDELQCQPLLFGKNLCVSFKTKQERNSSFSQCEKKFQVEKKGRYDFLKNTSRKEANDLREMSALAADICDPKSDSPQKGSVVCQKIKDKLPDAMKAINRGFIEAGIIQSSAAPDGNEGQPEPISTQSPPLLVAGEDCPPPAAAPESLAQNVADIQKQLNDPFDDSYEKIKKEFLSSPFCDPEKVINNSDQKPSAVYVGILMKEMQSLPYLNSAAQREEFLGKMQSKFNVSRIVHNEVSNLLSGGGDRKDIAAKAQGIILQDIIKNYRPGSHQLTQEMKEELTKKNIFKKNPSGEIECPFIGKDAFMKAMAGREEVLKSHGRSITHKNQITIVDYTRPSNERRMFVIDLSSNKVLHNTWTAHGIGKSEGGGIDGKGSSPSMSNQPGSLKSSDGFIIATAASHGNRFGPNVLLKGIDSNNSNLGARAVIIHGWASPMGEYSTGLQEYNYNTGLFNRPYDVIEKVMKTDFRSSTTKQMEDAIWGIKSSLITPTFLPPTEGCLGVPTINMKHLDRKGRNKDQVELLREDLPGSIIFNYSGPEMKSKYL